MGRLIEVLPSHLVDLSSTFGRLFADRFKITVTMLGLVQNRRVMRFIETNFTSSSGGRYTLTDPNAVLNLGSPSFPIR